MDFDWLDEVDCRICPVLHAGIDCVYHPDYADLTCWACIKKFEEKLLCQQKSSIAL